MTKVYNEMYDIMNKTVILNGDIESACKIVAEKNGYGKYYAENGVVYFNDGMKTTEVLKYDLSNGIVFETNNVFTFIRKCEDGGTMWSVTDGVKTATVIIDYLGRLDSVNYHN